MNPNNETIRFKNKKGEDIYITNSEKDEFFNEVLKSSYELTEKYGRISNLVTCIRYNQSHIPIWILGSVLTKVMLLVMTFIVCDNILYFVQVLIPLLFCFAYDWKIYKTLKQTSKLTSRDTISSI